MDTSEGQLETVAKGFFSEFSLLESESVGLALRALADDTAFANEAEQLLEFDSRLTLLKRLSLARRMPTALESELDAAILRARKLMGARSELQEAISGQAGTEQTNKEQARNDSKVAPSPAAPKRRRTRQADDEVQAHIAAAYRVHMLSRIETYTADAIALQHVMRDLAQHLAGPRSEGSSP
jgi:hypothetical protein